MNDTKAKAKKNSKPKNSRPPEFALYGWNACMRLFEKRPKDILRVFFSRARSAELGAVKKWCAARKLPYRQLNAEDLAKVAASVHHEGVVMVVRPLEARRAHALTREPLPKDAVLVALDRVEDVHNRGAILRSCAFFGVNGMVAPAAKEEKWFAPSAARMAEGALEVVPFYGCSDLASVLRDLRKQGAFVLGADLDARRSLYEASISFPCVLVVGNEREGLSEKVKKRCDTLVRIPGTQEMQSLNVSVAAGVVLAEIFRRKTQPV